MYKTILIPLDGSKRAEAILPHVEDIAKHYSSKLILLQVIELSWIITGPEMTYNTQYEKDMDYQTEQAKSYLGHLRKQFLEKGIDAAIQITQGPVVDAILHVADSEKVDLIALASHGRSGVSRVFYGSVAAGILQRVDRPLLLIRARSPM
ncbi:MAG: universal stress protein [Deltaproteobacteria bacterium]|nr:universal stress protein [Deltaproteobacteria bacterium]